ncbi:acyltransferase family protein [Nakamurella alba]|uniref:acyltransferase family protein n=1 Tax=Nakamurella alba TaxID=2665158 RepID=UPI0012B7F705|nr:acyltransferase [Nakamurella alba]
MADTLPVTAPVRRSAAIDIARGLAVCAVVALHIVNGLAPLDLIPDGNRLAPAIVDIGLLRLPALALLLGLFIPGGVGKRGVGGYIYSRVLIVGYMYVIWSVIQGAIGVITSGVRNNKTGILDILTLWTPELQLWFLPYVVVASVLMAVLRPWRHPVLGTVVLVVFAAVAVLMWGRNFEIAGTYGLSLLFFSAIGATVGLRRMVTALERPTWLWVLFGVIGTAGFLVAVRWPHRPAVTGEGGVTTSVLVASLIATLLGIVALLAVSKLLSMIPRVSEALQLIGRHTLEIYVMHIVLYAGTRVVLLKAGIENFTVHMVVGMLAGVGIPILAAVLAPRWHLGWLFSPPAWLDRGLRRIGLRLGIGQGVAPEANKAEAATGSVAHDRGASVQVPALPEQRDRRADAREHV